MNTLRIEAPTDSQLAYIASLCEDRGLEPPQVVASKAEASEIIARILAREYEPSAYAYDPAFGWNDGPF